MSLTKEQEKLFEENKMLAYATVHRRFNSPAFRRVHGLELEDLFQYALIGLFKACKHYKPDRDVKFSSYAINRIVWRINDESRKDSLNNIDNYTFDLLDKTSVDKEIYDGVTLHDILGGEDVSFSKFESSYAIEKLDKISNGLSQMVQLRLRGHTLKEVGGIMGMSHQAVRQRLLRYKDEIMQCLLEQ